MTEQTTTPAPGVESDSGALSGAPEGEETGEQDNGSEASRGNREATSQSKTDDAPASRNREARYRVERNEARTALAEAQARIEQYQRAEVERLSAELAQSSDLFEVGGASLADLLNEAGDVDSAAVAEAVAALIEARPGLAKNPRQRAVDPTQGLGARSGPPQPSFSGLFR